MKAYKIELLVLDFDQLGGDEIKSVLENSCYPNDCISPSAMRIMEADIGPWQDGSPLNKASTRAAEYARIFPAEALPAVANSWMPIETAPKDGTPILVLKKGFHPAVARWLEGQWMTANAEANYSNGNPCYLEWNLTHWQPLPAIPQ